MHSVVEQNLRSAMRCYAFIGNGSETREYPGLTIASSGLNVPVFNSAMLTAQPSESGDLDHNGGLALSDTETRVDVLGLRGYAPGQLARSCVCEQFSARKACRGSQASGYVCRRNLGSR